jgi:parvulin-like peptidyl-prolyl isomerase
MRLGWLIKVLFFLLFLGGGVVLGQETQMGSPVPEHKPGEAPSSSSSVPPQAVVVTIEGLCTDLAGSQTAAKTSVDAPAPPATENANCKTAITREQFENVVKAVSPKATPQAARGFAESYAETLLFAEQAHKLGLQKDPSSQELIKYKYLDLLFQIYKRYVKEKASEMSDAEVEKFYKEHLDRYEQLGLMRVHVPDLIWHDPAPGSTVAPKVDTAADAAAMKKVAEQLRREAAAGGDFEKLQVRAYKAAKITDDPPEVDLGDKWTIDNFPAAYVKDVFKLKPGQVSELVHNPSGWHIFKVVSRKTIPLSEAREFTAQLVVGDQANSLRDSIKTDLNEDYFHVTAAAPAGTMEPK